MFQVEINSLANLPEVAEKFMTHFKEERHFAFYGSMGAGKTTFIKELCKFMQTKDNTTSPTFALVNEYDTEKFGKIYHFDFYRLNSISEALDIGFEDYMESGNYCFMEWPERVEAILPNKLVEIHIDVAPSGKRILKAEIVS